MGYVGFMQTYAAAIPDRFITMQEMKDIMRGYSEAQIVRLERDGAIPTRVYIGKRRTAWLQSEVIEWMKNRPRVR